MIDKNKTFILPPRSFMTVDGMHIQFLENEDLVDEIEKHLPTRHDQKDHGRKRRSYKLDKFDSRDLAIWRSAVRRSWVEQDYSILYGSYIVVSDQSYALKDASGKAQVAYSLSSSDETVVGIEWLAVAPWNSRNVKERVSGWGTAAMYSIAKLALGKSIKQVRLSAGDAAAAKFYRAIGMKESANRMFKWSTLDMREFVSEYENRHD